MTSAFDLPDTIGISLSISSRAITVQTRNVIKIGRPGYKVTKARDLTTNQRSLLFEVDYPEAEDGAQPRHRFMSAYEQKVEAPDKGYQVKTTNARANSKKATVRQQPRNDCGRQRPPLHFPYVLFTEIDSEGYCS